MRTKENYLFTKRLYLDLMIDCKEKNDEKNFEVLKNGWEEIEEMYKDSNLLKAGWEEVKVGCG